LRTQQIIAEESGIPNTIDPLAGSYTIETMTQELVAKAESLIGDIDSKGGMLVCIEEGWIQSQIMDSAYKYQKEVESGERIIVGVNEYLEEEKTKLEEITKVENKSIEDHIRRLSNLKEKRGDVSQHLDILEQMASADNENLMPSIIDAVSAKVTIGEVCNSLRKVWGEYKPKEIL
jgi:methylmalonyl-CoA mutase N-terminal domain/subunit